MMRSTRQNLFLSICVTGLGLLVFACGGGGGVTSNTTDVQGEVASPFSDTPGAVFVEVTGREDLREMATTTTGVLQYAIADVPSDDRVVFKVTGGNVKETFSFPLEVGGVALANLGFVGTLTFDSLQTTFQNQLSSTAEPLDTSLSIVMGRVSGGQRANVSSIRLIDLNLTDAGQGPFFLENEDTAPAGVQLDDNIANLLTNGLYVFVNLPAGNYTILFGLGSGSEAFDLAVPNNSFVFGQDLP